MLVEPNVGLVDQVTVDSDHDPLTARIPPPDGEPSDAKTRNFALATPDVPTPVTEKRNRSRSCGLPSTRRDVAPPKFVDAWSCRIYASAVGAKVNVCAGWGAPWHWPVPES